MILSITAVSCKPNTATGSGVSSSDAQSEAVSNDSTDSNASTGQSGIASTSNVSTNASNTSVTSVSTKSSAPTVTTVPNKTLSGRIRFYTWASKEQIDEYKAELAKSFNKQYPNIQVRFETSQSNYFQNLLTFMSSGQEPDIFQMEPGEVMSFLTADKLEPLDKYIASSTKFTKSMLWPINSKAYRYDGTKLGSGSLYSIIKDWSPDYMLLYNKKHFDDAKIAYPSKTKAMTWDEFYALMNKLTVKEGTTIKRYGLLMDFVPYKQMVQYMVQNNGTWFDSSYNINLSSTNTKKSLDFFFKLMRDSGTGDYSGSNFGAYLFGNGGVSMYFGGRWMITDYKWLENGIDVGVAPPPVPTASSPNKVLTAGLVGFSISKNSRNKEAAWKFIEWHMSDYSIIQSKKGYNIPGNMLHSEQYFRNVSDPKVKAINEMFLDAANNYTVVIPSNPFCAAADFEAQLGNLGGQLIKNSITMNDFINQGKTKLQEIVDYNRD
jgi:multiple sugar transport system substrate-binding protein